jgi:uncharacterized protein YbaR (Trm112 family)
MDTRLLSLLVCPICKGPLQFDPEFTESGERNAQGGELLCRADRLAFPIRDGIPLMLEEQARSYDPDSPSRPAPLSGPGEPHAPAP